MTNSSKTQSADQSANAMWGGRFEGGPDAIMQAINASIGFDRRLCRAGYSQGRAPMRPCWPHRVS